VSATYLASLERELVSCPDRVVIVAGAGVSVASSSNATCASWKGLLQNGLNRCSEIGVAASRVDNTRQILLGVDAVANDYIAVATFVTNELKGSRDGEYAAWLISTIGAIPSANTRLIQSLHKIGGKLATTNYDHLLEVGGNGRTLTWLDHGLALEFFRSRSYTHDILHLHGSYLRPDSVVLGHRSYEEVCRNPAIQAQLRGAMLMGTFLFVGCGDGLDDLNFGTLLKWSREVLQESHNNHYILVLNSDVALWRSKLQGLPIVPIGYGAAHSDLSLFLELLAERVQALRTPNPMAGLITAQTSFDNQIANLNQDRESSSALAYLERLRAITMSLCESGGQHHATMAFSGEVTSRSNVLNVQDRIRFALDAARLLLDDELPDMAANHLQTAAAAVTPETPTVLTQHLARLQIRCFSELCAYQQLLQSIARELLHATGEERDRLEAIRDETMWLQGHFPQN
jgi:hypothetical protein